MHIGGQAVIEGVMMASPNYMAVSVRKNNKKIITKKSKFKKKPDFLKLFFIRGIFNLINMLVIGMKSLMWSAEQVAEEEDEKIGKTELGFTLLFSIAIAVGLFILLPYFLSAIFIDTRGVYFNLVDGILRMIVFLGYVIAISLMNDVRRVFEYHGAEHKAVNCYEAGKAVNVKNVDKFGTIHVRCGTNFIMIVLMTSIIVFSLIKSEVWYVNILWRLLLMPVIAGISYEFIRFSGKYDNKILRFFSMPGLWLQKLTTRKPSKDQIEVAIKSLKEIIKLENA